MSLQAIDKCPLQEDFFPETSDRLKVALNEAT